ncbi:lipocalin-like domain-containing protein [Photobacterium damselae subsp. damselae]|uniref:Lipocalin-like domain-containing protein n=1 Tax=Photobacterium damselae subsp. damselae TaxID=85581 RepID=A0A850QVY6_PHODD|nr:lipocalin-like domain-containing protein [Photobacterium damselae subsp. damselae]
MNISDLYGAWELVSFKHTVLDTHIETNIMGEKPKGKIIFTEDNIVSVMITSDRQHLIDSVKESERNDFLYKNMMAYMPNLISKMMYVISIFKFLGIHLGSA